MKTDSSPETEDKPQIICATHCLRCHSVLKTVFVHGHEQCATCHAVVEDCCQGAPV